MKTTEKVTPSARSRIDRDLSASPLRVLWPLAGYPAWIDTEQECPTLEIFVSHRHSAPEQLPKWARGSFLRTRQTTSRTIPLHLLSVDPLDSSSLPEVISGTGSLPGNRNRSFARVSFRVPKAELTRGAGPGRLLDLVWNRRFLHSRTVAPIPKHQPLRIGFACDFHTAAVWDRIGEAVRRFAPERLPAFLHPNDHLKTFIDRANQLAERGELDLVVLGGDLVEYVYDALSSPDFDPALGRRNSNVVSFLRALEALELPSFALPGNHDFRLFPWRPRVYGLSAVGIPPPHLRPLLKNAGLWDRLPFRPRDLLSLRTVEGPGHPPLDHFLSAVCPAENFCLRIGDLRLVFLNSGRDLLPQWRSLERGRLPLLARTLSSTWRLPDSEGFSDGQIDFLRRSLAAKGGGAVIFTHAPLFNPPPQTRVEEAMPRLVGSQLDPSTEGGRFAFERDLLKSGCRHGVFFRNPGPFLRTLLEFDGSLAVFAGHTHRSHSFSLSRKTLTFHSVVAQDSETRPPDSIGFFNAPAVGHLSPVSPEPPGFLTASFDRGTLVRVEPTSLGSIDVRPG